MNAQQLRNSILQEAIEGRLVPPACRQAGKTLTMNPQTYIKGQSCWFTYVIECEDGSFYKGFTDNLLRRYKQHCDGIGAEHTKRHKPKQLYYWEMHYSQEEALAREKYLKSGSGREWFQREVVEKADNWEPASVLLAKIRKEKEILVKEGKLKKKDLIETPITEEEIPFEIPESWEWCRIPDIGISQLGKTKNPHQLSGLSLPYICSINVYWEGINLNQTKEMLFEESEIDKYTIKKGDLLICEGGDCGRSAIWDKENTILYQNALHRVRFFCNIESTYILYCLYLYKTSNQLEDYIKGETIKHLVKGELDSILFPLPPLAEQKRIVAKIEELLPKVEEYGKAQDELNKLNEELPERLKKSILQEAIEGRLVPQDPNDEPASVLLDRIRKEKERLYKAGLLKKKEITDRVIKENEVPFSLPDGWLWTKIDNVAFVTKLAGFEYSKYIADNLVSKEKGVPLFKGKNVQNGKIVYEFEAYIPIELSNELLRSQINKKCLLTPYVGTIGNIGIHDKKGIYHLGSNVGKIEFYNGDSMNILEEYVKYYLMSSYGYDELTKYKKATAQESISIEAIRDVFIPLPPLAEQHRIVNKLEQLLGKIEQMKK